MRTQGWPGSFFWRRRSSKMFFKSICSQSQPLGSNTRSLLRQTSHMARISPALPRHAKGTLFVPTRRSQIRQQEGILKPSNQQVHVPPTTPVSPTCNSTPTSACLRAVPKEFCDLLAPIRFSLGLGWASGGVARGTDLAFCRFLLDR